jgi:thiosulfate/3-mercaptopyruvate sulfurtransferase
MNGETVLVTTEWLYEHLVDPDLRVVEVDEDADAYYRGHIPGAVPVHWSRDLQDPVRRDFVDAKAFADLQDRLGITNATRVVLYGGNNNWFAAYAYWYYKVYGHRAIALLDGGRKAWELEQKPMGTPVTPIEATAGYRTAEPDLTIRAFRARVLNDVIGNPGAALVDVRSPEEFRGEKLAPDHLPQEGAQRPGHIPGATNVPWAKAVDPETGRFLAEGKLKALYAGHGITTNKDVVAYCRIGERSAHTWFVLHEILRYPNVRNYDGSWTEWGSLVGVPIER